MSNSLQPMDYSTPGFPVLHYLLEFVQTHVHWIDDAIQPSQPLSRPSLSALNLSQHQGLFQWSNSLYQVSKASGSSSVPPMNIQDWFPLGMTGLISLQSKRLSKVFSNTTVQKYQSGQNMVHWTRKWKTTSAFLSWEPHEHIMKRQKDFLL